MRAVSPYLLSLFSEAAGTSYFSEAAGTSGVLVSGRLFFTGGAVSGSASGSSFCGKSSCGITQSLHRHFSHSGSLTPSGM